MKNRNLDHKDDWATPVDAYEKWNKEFNFDFDPCPFQHDLTKWDGLKVEWGHRNYCNPGYSLKIKEAFVKKAIEESKKGKLCVCLLPVSTSTKLFQDFILPNQKKIRFLRGRLKFTGINSKGQLVNYLNPTDETIDLEYPSVIDGTLQVVPIPLHVKNQGMHDSMLVIFDGRK